MRTEYLPTNWRFAWVGWGLTPTRVARWSAGALLAAGLAAAPAPVAAAEANVPANVPTIAVTGSSLANIVMSPLALTPAFDPTITDYVLRCQAGINTVDVSLVADGGTINAQGNHGATLDIHVDLIENEALVVVARAPHSLVRAQPNKAGEVDESGRIQYWIRCLPHDFPELSVARPGNVPSGWYLTNNFTTASGTSPYTMVLDNYGTPVWYQKAVNGTVSDVTPLRDGTIAWWLDGVFDVYNPGTQATRVITSPDLYIDIHELDPLPNGNVMVLSYPQKPNVDLTALGMGPSATIFDCLITELDSRGNAVWQWRASDHISPGESLHPLGADIFHCNSVDTDPLSGNVLLSSRENDAVYLIAKNTGNIIWKLGGNSLNHDHEQTVAITGDPEGAFDAQHDARFQPNGDISLYDDQSFTGLSARAVEYQIDTSAGRATLVWAYQSADGKRSFATGSFRRLSGGTDNVVGWGAKPNSPLFTEVDALGRVLLTVWFTNGDWSYRVIKVAVAALDHGFLRATAGLPQFVRPSSPKMSFVGSSRGSATAGASVTITGTGLTGATAVTFGPNRARAFTVNNDSSITATVPPGTGSVNVTVTTPGGTTLTRAQNIMSTIDSDFEGDLGSWRSADTLAVTTAYVQSGSYSLQVLPASDGNESVASGRYALPPQAMASGSQSMLTPQGPHRVRAFIAFYDSRGELISVVKGPWVTTSGSAWTRVAATTVSPHGTTSAALGFEDTSGSGPSYLDAASLVGSDTFAYDDQTK